MMAKKTKQKRATKAEGDNFSLPASHFSVPKLRFPEFRNAPEWEENELKRFLSESRIPGNKGDIAKKITVKLWGKGVFEKNEDIQGSANTQYYRRTAGQFIYSKLDFLNQAFGVIPDHLDGYESTVDLPCFDLTNKIDPIFLLEYVKRKDFYEKYGETADGSRKARRIHADTFLSFPIFMPSLSEQQKIAECLSSVDELIAAQARKVDALKAHKKGLMQQLFPAVGETTPALRFPEFRHAPEWEEKTFEALYDFKPNNNFSRDQLNYNGGTVKNIHYGDIHTRFSTHFHINAEEVPFVNADALPNELNPESLCRPGDMIFADASEDLTDVGKCIEVVGMNDERVLSGSHTILARPRSKSIIVGFGGYLFKSRPARAGIEREAQGTKVMQISPKRLATIEVLFPSSKQEQQKIAECLSSVDSLIAAQERKLDALKLHKKGLMQQLFPATGGDTSS